MLWEKGLLGSHSSQVLVDTTLYMAGLYLALRSGDEHRRLCFSDVELVEKAGNVPHLVYTESVSKKNPGGLGHRKVDAKRVCHYANTGWPKRCFVELYKQYRLHRPRDIKIDVFYLAPIPNPNGVVWYKKQAIGVNSLSNTIKRLCIKGGVDGYKANHSLRVTSAIRIFPSGTEEQLIMERTGHRSTDGVRIYKRSSAEQQAVVSSVLNREKSSVLLSALLLKAWRKKISLLQKSSKASLLLLHLMLSPMYHFLVVAELHQLSLWFYVMCLYWCASLVHPLCTFC